MRSDHAGRGSASSLPGDELSVSDDSPATPPFLEGSGSERFATTRADLNWSSLRRRPGMRRQDAARATGQTYH